MKIGLLGLTSIAIAMLFQSCVGRNEKMAAEAIAGLVNARECRVQHAVLSEAIDGGDLGAKKVVVLNVEGVAQYDSISRKDLVTSLAALRYYQWQAEEELETFDRVEVNASGQLSSFSEAYSMEELSEVASLEPLVDKSLRLVREKGYKGLNEVLESSSLSDSAQAKFSSALERADSLFGAVTVARIVGYRFVEDELASSRLFVFAVFIGNNRNDGSYMELAVNPINQRVVAVDTFQPW